jgi:hypothetical protein
LCYCSSVLDVRFLLQRLGRAFRDVTLCSSGKPDIQQECPAFIFEIKLCQANSEQGGGDRHRHMPAAVHLAQFLTLKLEAVCSETSVNSYQTLWHYISDDSVLLKMHFCLNIIYTLLFQRNRKQVYNAVTVWACTARII